MKVIFLDFDGVMDTGYYFAALIREHKPRFDSYGMVFDPYCIENLRKIIDKTGAKIVVSSTWKDSMYSEEILEMWHNRNLPGIVIGTTPTYDNKARGYEIDTWLDECDEECQYVIIDDLEAYNFTERQLPHLLVVNQYIGLDDLTAERAILILNQGI